MLPNDARKSIHGGLVRPRKFPATTPKLISISATETPSSTEATLARRMRRPAITAIRRFSIRPPVVQLVHPSLWLSRIPTGRSADGLLQLLAADKKTPTGAQPVGVISLASREAVSGEPHRPLVSPRLSSLPVAGHGFRAPRRLKPEYLPHSLADEYVDHRLRQLPYSWRHGSELVPSRGRLRIVWRQLSDAVESLLKFASLRGLKVGRLNAGLEPLDQLLAREPRGGVATMGTEISPLPSSRVPGERPLTSAGGAVGEHPRSVV